MPLQTVLHNIKLSAKKTVGHLENGARYDCILSQHLSKLANGLLSLTDIATPCRFRFVKVDRSWLNNSDHKDLKIEIHEFKSLPDRLDYCAISYPWAGVKYRQDKRGYITVAGAQSADPIAISILYDLSWAAWSVFKSEYIWLDRLCLMQENSDDKKWQIARMFDIYHKCKSCIVIPGGLQRLVVLEEETEWVDRAWTLQEVTAPQVTKVSVLYNPNSPANAILEPFRSDGRFWSDTNLVYYEHGGRRALMYMCEAMRRFTNQTHLFFGFKPSQYLTVVHCLQGVNQKQHDALWEAAMMRTSSRPCDRIYSIMQLFGVNLSQDYWEEDDTVGPAIALVQASLAAAHNLNYPHFEWDKAVPPRTLSWFLSAYWMDPHPNYSAFPRFPETSVDGPAVWVCGDGVKVKVADALQYRLGYLSRNWYPNVSYTHNAMDSYGYLTLTSPLVLPLTDLTYQYSSAPIPTPDGYSMIGPDVFFCPLTRTCWRLWQPAYGYPAQRDYYLSQADALAVWIGATASHGYHKNPYGGFNYVHEDSDTYIIVKRHAPWRFHRITHLNISRPYKHPFDDMMAFPQVSVVIGGPTEYVNKKL